MLMGYFMKMKGQQHTHFEFFNQKTKQRGYSIVAPKYIRISRQLSMF